MTHKVCVGNSPQPPKKAWETWPKIDKTKFPPVRTPPPRNLRLGAADNSTRFGKLKWTKVSDRIRLRNGGFNLGQGLAGLAGSGVELRLGNGVRLGSALESKHKCCNCGRVGHLPGHRRGGGGCRDDSHLTPPCEGLVCRNMGSPTGPGAAR